MSNNWQSSLEGAYATPDLVGRKEILDLVMARVQDRGTKRPCFIFLKGPGGIGKTRILIELNTRCQAMPNIKTARQLVDVYHLIYHSSYEMSQALYNAIKPRGSEFSLYEKSARDLDRAKLSGESKKIEEKQKNTLQAFINDLSDLAEQQPVVLFLDTLERFSYDSGDLDGVPDCAETWDWLVQALPALSNVIFIAGGRPQATPLIEKLPADIDIIPIDVNVFSLEESMDYFDAAARMTRQSGAAETANRLEALSQDEKEQVHRLTRGRPILLALLADYLTSGGRMVELMTFPGSEQAQDLPDQYLQIVLNHILGVQGFGELLRAMALMPKGMNLELAIKILGSEQKARQYLHQIERLSFVKVRRSAEDPREDAYFLHDEMFVMIQQAAFSTVHSHAERLDLYHQIIEYYELRLNKTRDNLAILFRELASGGFTGLDYDQLNRLLTQKMEMLTTLLYYRLREDGAKGWRRWYRYDHDAVMSGDLLLCLQLQVELQTYLHERSVAGNAKDNLDIDLVRWAILLHPAKDAYAKQELTKVGDECARLEQKYPTNLANPVQRALLMVWKAYAQGMQGQSQSAIDALDTIVKDATLVSSMKMDYQDGDDITPKWLATVILAFAHRISGYLYRIQGQIRESIEHYQLSIKLLRGVDLKVEMATAHNDLGFALAMHGDWEDARSMMMDGLELREYLGLGIPVAYSLNTLAMLDIYEGLYNEAINRSTQALNLFRALNHKRGEGMALTAVAEATRRNCGLQAGPEIRKQLESLNSAYEMAALALDIFESTGEQTRLPDVYLEMGCARRDAVRLVSENPDNVFGKEKWLKESEKALELAATKAHELAEDNPGKIHFREADARVNMIVLGDYAGGEEGKAIRERAERLSIELLRDYEFQQGQEKISEPAIFGKPEYQPTLSAQLGKLHILSGHRIYKARIDQETGQSIWKTRITSRNRDKLVYAYEELARDYFLGLEHSGRFGANYRDLRIAKQQIFDNLKTMRPENIDLFSTSLEKIEQTHLKGKKSELRKMMEKRALI